MFIFHRLVHIKDANVPDEKCCGIVIDLNFLKEFMGLIYDIN
jgi:hypothetical protein